MHIGFPEAFIVGLQVIKRLPKDQKFNIYGYSVYITIEKWYVQKDSLHWISDPLQIGDGLVCKSQVHQSFVRAYLLVMFNASIL